MKKKYYVVLRGWQRDIFDNWGDCQYSISGYKGADYQGFGDLEDAADQEKYLPGAGALRNEQAAPEGPGA